MIDPKIVGLLDHPLAGFAIAAALCIYHPFALWSGKRVLHRWFRERLADVNLMKQVRMLGSELSTISMAAMVKAAFDPKSNLTVAINTIDPHATWVFYAWLAGIYLTLVFTPSVFVRYALLEREPGHQESERHWSKFIWRWTMVSWFLGFVNLRIALKFMTSH